MPLSDDEWAALARDFRRAVARSAPEWTNSKTGDPGITILELFTFVLDNLVYRTGAATPRVRALAEEVVRRAAALAAGPGTGDADDDCGGGLRRVRYFSGKLLDASDLQAEQDYLLDRLSRRNRLLYGSGIVDGLDVTVASDGDGPHVEIAPGLAFDLRGREIFVDGGCRIALASSDVALLVQLAYRERPCRAVPASTINPGSDPAALQATRVAETFEASVAPAPIEGAVSIARLRCTRGRWRIDPTFKAQRVRR